MAKILVVDDDTKSLRLAVAVLAMKGDAERLVARGVGGYLEKPIRYRQFLASVAALLEEGPS